MTRRGREGGGWELTAIDVLVLLAIGGAGILGLLRGFVTEVLSLFAWLMIVFMVKLFHLPLTQALAPIVGKGSGAAVLAFALLVGITYFGGRLVARTIGGRVRDSGVGSIDRVLGLGFGALKGLILVSLVFLLLMLVVDTVSGGPAQRPKWITQSLTYPLLNATSASIAEFVDRRRKGEPVFVSGNQAAPAENVEVPSSD